MMKKEDYEFENSKLTINLYIIGGIISYLIAQQIELSVDPTRYYLNLKDYIVTVFAFLIFIQSINMYFIKSDLSLQKIIHKFQTIKYETEEDKKEDEE